MINYKIVYLADIFNGLQLVGIVIFAITLVLMAVFLFFWGLDPNTKNFSKKHPNFKKAFLICLILCFLGAALSIMPPSKENLAAIMAAKIAAEKNIPLERTVNLKQTILKLIDGNDTRTD